MSEPDNKKRGLRAMFSRNRMLLSAIFVLLAILLPIANDLLSDPQKRGEVYAVRTKAYLSIAQFAPWNIAQRYVAIVFTQGNSYAESLAQQQEQLRLLFRGFACSVRETASSGSMSADPTDPCRPQEQPHGVRAFYLSAHVPMPLRFITAFFDLLLHAFVDLGMIGFLVAAAQIAVGVKLTRIAINSGWLKLDSFYSYLLAAPLSVFVLGSIGAILPWGFAWVGMWGLKAAPLLGIGAQAGGNGCMWVLANKVGESALHAALMKQAERVLHD